MAVEYQNKYEDNTTAGTSLTLTAPTGFSAGDLFIAIVVKDDDPAITTPNGWTNLRNAAIILGDKQAYIDVSYRIAEAGDTSWDWIGDNEAWYGVILRYTGQDTTTPIYSTTSLYLDSDTPQAPGKLYTDLETGSLVLRAFGNDNDRSPMTNIADDPALTERFNNVYAGNGGCGAAGGDAVISGSGTLNADYIYTLNAADEWFAVTIIIEAAGGGVVEIAGVVNASASTDGALVFTWGLAGEVSGAGQTISLLKKFQQYIFPFSYDDKEWTLSQASIQSGILDITGISGYGRRNPDSVWYSGSTDDFEIEVDFKQDSTGTIGARIEIFVIGDPFTLRFEVRGSEDLMRIHHNGVTRASQAFTDDTSWHTMKVRRVGTTYYMSIDAGDEISWDYGTERVISWIGLQMFGITGDFDDFKYKWEDATCLRGGVVSLSQVDGILLIFKLLAGIINAQSQTDGNIVSTWSLLGDINAQSQTDASLLRIFSILGEVAGQSQTDGNIVATWSLAGAVDALAQTLGDITIGGLIEIAGVVNALSQVDGNIIANWALMGDIDGASQTIGALAVLKDLMGSISASGQTDVQLAVLRDLMGNIQSQSQTTGLLKKEFGIIGAIDALSQTDGQLAVLRDLVGAIDAISQTDGTLLRIYSLSGAVDALSQIDGIIAMTRGLSGTVAAESQTIADLFIVIIKYLKGQIESQSQTSGFLVIDRTLVGAINALSQIDGAINMITYVELQGAIAAISDLLSDLDVR